MFGIAEVRADYGLRAELAALHGVSECVQDLLTSVDRVVRIGREDFLVVLPSWSPEKVMWFCEEVCERVARLEDTYPFIALPGVAPPPSPAAGLCRSPSSCTRSSSAAARPSR